MFVDILITLFMAFTVSVLFSQLTEGLIEILENKGIKEATTKVLIFCYTIFLSIFIYFVRKYGVW